VSIRRLAEPAGIRTYVRLMFLSWGLGKRTTRPTPGRSPHRWNDAPSCSASIWPPSDEQRPVSTLTSESTGPRSGASCNWSGTSALRHTGGSEAVTSAADGTRQSTANLRALGRCSRGGEAIELATAENRRPAGCAIPGKESHRPGRPPGQLVPPTCPTRPGGRTRGRDSLHGHQACSHERQPVPRPTRP
jgi:hypothetical protein